MINTNAPLTTEMLEKVFGEFFKNPAATAPKSESMNVGITKALSVYMLQNPQKFKEFTTHKISDIQGSCLSVLTGGHHTAKAIPFVSAMETMFDNDAVLEDIVKVIENTLMTTDFNDHILASLSFTRLQCQSRFNGCVALLKLKEYDVTDEAIPHLKKRRKECLVFIATVLLLL